MNNISNGVIDEIIMDQENLLLTVVYIDGIDSENAQTIRLVVSPQTVVLNNNGMQVPASILCVGMVINAVISDAMTRSIPPQAAAHIIRIEREPLQEMMVTIGTIVEVDDNNRNFMTVSDGDFSTMIQFNVPEDALIFDRFGRPIHFGELKPQMKVKVCHANFMTASIPPQTTAYEVRVL